MLVAAVLGVLALAGATGSVVQWLGDDQGDVGDLETQVALITAERDDLLAANEDLATEVDRLGAVAAQGVAALDDTTAELAAMTAELDQASADLDAARADNASLSAELATASTTIDGLAASVGDLQETNAAVTAERDALVAMFPMVVDTSLVGIDVTGTYTVDWFAAYNSGLADIALPSVTKVSITRTAEGWLRVTIPGVVEAGLMRTDGALFTMVDTTAAVPPVDGVPRLARVALTIYAGETVTAADGTTMVSDLGLSIAISTPAVGSTPDGVALYGATLTPQN